MKLPKLALVMSVVSVTCLAQTRDELLLSLKGLTDTQKLELALQAKKMKCPEYKLSHLLDFNWEEIGKNIAKATSSAAKEVQMSPDEFLHTYLGKIIVFTIAWSIIGDQAAEASHDIIDIIVLSPLFLIWTMVFIYSYRREFIIHSIIYGDKKDGYKKKVEYVNIKDQSDSYYLLRMLHIIIFLLVSLGMLAKMLN